MSASRWLAWRIPALLAAVAVVHAGWSAEADPEGALRRMHDQHVLRFIQSNGFGAERLLVMGMDEDGMHYGKPVADTEWFISELSLIGVAMHDPPQVFGNGLGSWIGHQPDESSVQADEWEGQAGRAPTPAEYDALRALQSGRELVTQPVGKGLRVYGAIRAGDECLGCHRDQRAGDLLGAFAYRLRPQGLHPPPPSVGPSPQPVQQTRR